MAAPNRARSDVGSEGRAGYNPKNSVGNQLLTRPWHRACFGAFHRTRKVLERIILDKFAASLHDRGVVGEQTATQLVYLAVVSRLLHRPVSVVVKGPSSGGKSWVTEKTLDHFPVSAYHALSAMSEHALIYSREPLKHRMLVFYEAPGMAGEMQTYLVRTLLSEGRLRYETVDKNLEPRLIEREWPTGAIITTTKVALHPENETRLISVTVDDSSDQTAAVMRGAARRYERGPDDPTYYARWHALQAA